MSLTALILFVAGIVLGARFAAVVNPVVDSLWASARGVWNRFTNGKPKDGAQ